MKKYWVMRTLQEWWETFQTDCVIGIDEDGVDSNYLALTQHDIDALLVTADNNFNDYQNRIFQEFSKWMQVDDFVIIGTGVFNITGIARVSSAYNFNINSTPRHIRHIEFLKIFPVLLQCRDSAALRVLSGLMKMIF